MAGCFMLVVEDHDLLHISIKAFFASPFALAAYSSSLAVLKPLTTAQPQTLLLMGASLAQRQAPEKPVSCQNGAKTANRQQLFE